jgi:hypothetical protein
MTPIKIVAVVFVSCLAFVPEPGAQADQGGSYTFRFDPGGDDSRFTQRVTTTRTKDLGGGDARVDESKTETGVQVRRTESGYLVSATPMSAEMTRDGRPIENPIANALQQIEMSYRLDEEGRLVEITGVEEAVDRIMSSLPEEARQAVSGLINAEMLIARETTEWNGRIGDFIGATVTTGDTWSWEAPFTLPNGEEIPFHTVIAFEKILPCGSCSCLEVVTSYSSDATAMANLASETVSKIVESAGEGTEVANASGTIEGVSRRVIDPNTMRIHSEHLERTISFVLDQGVSEPAPVVMTEERDYRYEYADEYCGGE